MKMRLLLWWDEIRSAYWFMPTLMLVGSAVLAVLLVTIDKNVKDEDLQGAWWIFSGGAEGARSLLSTVAGSVIGVAGTTFSITIAVLSLTSSQFGPRLLRGFLRDRGNQFVLGTFVATFLYCLLVLRTIRSVEEIKFVPHIAVTGGMILAVICVGVLIYFIHHVSTAIQASYIISNVSSEMEEAIDRLFPSEIGDDACKPTTMPFSLAERTGLPVCASRNGYVQAIDGEALLALASERNLVVRLERQPGQFATRGRPLATVYAATDSEARDVANAAGVADSFTIGNHRTAAQDSDFLLLQLTEIAVRALSPGVNDPYTAVTCLDHIGAILCQLMGRRFPTGQRADAQGMVRVLSDAPTFVAMLDTALAEIYHYGKEDPIVMARLQQILGDIKECAGTDSNRAAVQQVITRYTTKA